MDSEREENWRLFSASKSASPGSYWCASSPLPPYFRLQVENRALTLLYTDSFPGKKKQSLDRTVKIWDLRKTEKLGGGGDGDRTLALVGQNTSRLSVSCALWSSTGSLATASYDDTVKIYKFPGATEWGVGKDLGKIEPDVTIPHNNQTGRHVSNFPYPPLPKTSSFDIY